MKKVIATLLLFALLSTLLILPAAAETYAWVKTGNGKGLYMREGPGKNYEIVCTLAYRTRVIVHEYTNGWALVEPADYTMSNPKYVSANFLVSSDPGPYQGGSSSGSGSSSSDSTVTYAEIDAALQTMKVLDTPYYAVIKTSRPTNYVHLRWIPNTGARYIEKYLCNTEILVLAESTYWAQVQIVESGYVGFILKSNVDALLDANGGEG